MWNKREEELIRPAAASQAAVPPTVATTRREQSAAIGPSISIVGDLTGDEDLTILGRVQGKITLPKHSVTVGESGRVDADIHAKVVSVAGEVRGNLLAGEQILIRKTATMLGNLTAPRVGLEDGCCFRGSVDMEAQPSRGAGALVKSAGAAVPPAASPDGSKPATPEVPLVRP